MTSRSQLVVRTGHPGRRSFFVVAMAIAAVGLIGLFATTSVSGGWAGPNPKAEPIRIGAVLPLTGGSAAWGQQGRWGIDFAVRERNKAGGIGGRPVEVIYEDSQAVPRIAVTAFNKLSRLDNVSAVIGDIVSATTLAMAPLAEERQIVLIAPTASAPALTKAGRFIWRVWPSDLLEGAAAANWAATEDVHTTAIVALSNDYGSGLAAAFRRTFEGKGGNIVSVQSYGLDETDFRAQLIRVRALSPDLLYIVGYYKDTALILKQAAELGLKTRMLGATAVESPDLLAIAGSAAEGLNFATIVDFDPSNPNLEQKRFIDEFSALYGKAPDWASSHAHDAAMVVMDAMASGARTGEEIRDTIDRRRVFHGVTGTITFDGNGDVIDKPVVMKTVRNGAFAALEQHR